ncbi:Mur ligase family protein [Campylobacter sp. JMF_06 NA1]|uniref:Mur ligase family protein n=1 Tax=Campylobacter sp. JMF_06 NA1 TaxID=2983823 RepID=UPI0022E9F158|nr:Mur ligase family protein [Campylobacter sp. JMF_06 NA1]MDA3077366.1 Mur ligase family protein [Campylobacter sp. JMF_06 NA1]
MNALKTSLVFDFLNARPIYYKKIDYERFPAAFEAVRSALPLKNITQIIGTNGKGSTGRFLSRIIMSANGANGRNSGPKFSVGHYTSPHIMRLNERIYRDGREISDDELQGAHEFLQANLPAKFRNNLSYFEYLTLAAAVHFRECDYCVFEAGMGGEFDATSSFDRELSLFTPIGTDHIGMLGVNLEQISRTKLNAMAQNAILSDEMNEISVKIAREIAAQKGANLAFASDFLNADEKREIAEYIKTHNLANFQYSNLKLAVAGAKFWGLNFKIAEILPLDLPGRAEAIAPNIIIDVGHNELAAAALAKEFAGKKFTLIYNAFADKDIKKVLATLAPIIKNVQILPYEAPGRELGGEMITRALDELGIAHSEFRGETYENELYLVFGSFHLVEEFLKFYNNGAKFGKN